MMRSTHAHAHALFGQTSIAFPPTSAMAVSKHEARPTSCNGYTGEVRRCQINTTYKQCHLCPCYMTLVRVDMIARSHSTATVGHRKASRDKQYGAITIWQVVYCLTWPLLRPASGNVLTARNIYPSSKDGGPTSTVIYAHMPRLGFR